MTDYHFTPCPDRARAIDIRMRASLGESLTYIIGEVEGLIPVSSQGRQALELLTHNLAEGGRYSPAVFGVYADLVLALTEGDNTRAAGLLDLLGQQQPQRRNLEILSLDAAEPAAHRVRYQQLLDVDPNARFPILPPSPAVAETFRQRLTDARQLMQRALPALAGEFDALVSQVIMVTADPEAAFQFDGGSSYMLWGGLFLNADSHHTRVDLVEVLAHESAHMLLFGFSCDEALVNNDNDSVYHSPLRSDPRPMDGIYHATWVSARMHWALRELLEGGHLAPEDREKARESLTHHCRHFADGLAVVESGGDLTPTGRAVMEAARSYMRPFLETGL